MYKIQTQTTSMSRHLQQKMTMMSIQEFGLQTSNYKQNPPSPAWLLPEAVANLSFALCLNTRMNLNIWWSEGSFTCLLLFGFA